MKSKLILLLTSLMLITGFAAKEVCCEPVNLPMTIDMPLLRSLIVQQAYTGQGETARVVDDGCNLVILSAPQVQEKEGRLRFQTSIRLQLGTAVAGKCFAPLSWQGIVVLLQRPQVSEEWQLSFATDQSLLLDHNGKSATLAGLAWNQVKNHVHNYLGRITIDLSPSVHNVKNFLFPLFDAAHQGAGKRFLASMRPKQPLITENTVRVNILADLDTGGQQEASPVVAASPEELAKLMELWETWDAFLVHLIIQFSGNTLNEPDRQTLMEVLLTVRYAFEEALSGNQLTNAFIRKQFLWSWQYLEPVFHRHLLNAQSGNFLGYLSFFTAVDALATLDHIGPSLGIEISRTGFHRLAGMISSSPDNYLQLPPGVNLQLRKVFGLGEEVEGAPPEPVDGGPTSWYRPPVDWRIWKLFSLCSAAWAGEFKQPGLKEIRKWTPAGTPADVLLRKVRSVLIQAMIKQEGSLKLINVDSVWFEKMLMATAWQESCFRQFHVKKKKLTYLLSYNQSSVGVMQINERIWRGIYNRNQLRWDIRYNARAGAEILTLYLKKYINRKKKVSTLSSKSNRRFLAVWLYSLYNGGPAQLKKLPKRYEKKQLYKSENLFLAKYDQIQEKNWMKLVKCQ